MNESINSGNTPTDEWTIEQLLHWSLDQYQTQTIERTSAAVTHLREQCQKECEDVMTLHSMAVDMASKNCKVGEEEVGEVGGLEGGSSGIGGSGEENVNPQEYQSTTAEVGVAKPMSNTNSTSTSTTTTATTNATSFAAGTKQSSSYPIEVQMIVGPHTDSNYMLRPKLGQPCLIGRSKGKKFIKNGVSLHKDQEISTTHGKFVVEGGGLGLGGGLGGGAATTSGPRYYFVDVGSTNGTLYKGGALMPNDKLLLETGMELKVGNSVLRVVLP